MTDTMMRAGIRLPRELPIAASSMATPFGAFVFATIEGTVLAAAGPRPGSRDALAWARIRWPGHNVVRGGAANRELIAQLRAYFAGTRRGLDVALTLDGSDLNVRAWLSAIEIPYGKSLTYGDLAWEVGAPGAARAMGRAMTLCELPVFVPCHRVIGSGGRRCGSPESWERRQALLEFERRQLAGAAPRGVARR
jgi:O-6-methylguanine DNA methyltransferase